MSFGERLIDLHMLPIR